MRRRIRNRRHALSLVGEGLYFLERLMLRYGLSPDSCGPQNLVRFLAAYLLARQRHGEENGWSEVTSRISEYFPGARTQEDPTVDYARLRAAASRLLRHSAIRLR